MSNLSGNDLDPERGSAKTVEMRSSDRISKVERDQARALSHSLTSLTYFRVKRPKFWIEGEDEMKTSPSVDENYLGKLGQPRHFLREGGMFS